MALGTLDWRGRTAGTYPVQPDGPAAAWPEPLVLRAGENSWTQLQGAQGQREEQRSRHGLRCSEVLRLQEENESKRRKRYTTPARGDRSDWFYSRGRPGIRKCFSLQKATRGCRGTKPSSRNVESFAQFRRQLVPSPGNINHAAFSYSAAAAAAILFGLASHVT
uniref:Uncharacterized protein n=1 Tax=Sphaerodactylus townsendi TaxID=933632 RepID=A0ACB8EIV6_9SAUR